MTVVDEYLNTASRPEKAALELIRKKVKEIIPDAEEAMVYGVPGFKYKGKFFLGFAINKGFLSIYPGSKAIKQLDSKLTKYQKSKGAVRFTVGNPIPESVLGQMVKIRLNEVGGN